MTAIVERLRKQDCRTMLDAYDVMDAAADEIERLKAELAASQARQAQLLKQLWSVNKWMRSGFIRAVCSYGQNFTESKRSFLDTYDMYEKAISNPSDDTTLQEAIKQGQREALLKAAEWCNHHAQENIQIRMYFANELRRMAEEIEV